MRLTSLPKARCANVFIPPLCSKQHRQHHSRGKRTHGALKFVHPSKYMDAPVDVKTRMVTRRNHQPRSRSELGALSVTFAPTGPVPIDFKSQIYPSCALFSRGNNAPLRGSTLETLHGETCHSPTDTILYRNIQTKDCN